MLPGVVRSFLASGLLYVVAASAAHAADGTPPTIAAVPGKEVCAAAAGTNAMAAELCVTGGNFSHDRYALKLGGRTVLNGIDDQTTAGIASKVNNQNVVLQCVPQNVFPKATPAENLAEVRRVLPNASEARVKEIADLLVPPMGMELGRLCTATGDGQAFLAVQVVFD